MGSWFGLRTFQQKLRLLIVVAPCLVLLLTMTVQVYVGRTLAMAQEERLATVTVQAAVQELDEFHAHIAAITNAIAARQHAYGRESDPKMVDFLKEIFHSENARNPGAGDFYGVYFAFDHKRGQEPGSVQWVNRRQDGTENALEYDHHEPTEEWYNGPKGTGKLYLTSPYRDRGDGVEMVSVTRPVYDRGGQFVGVAGVDISLHALRRIMERKQAQLRPSSQAFGGETVYLVTRGGEEVTRTRTGNEHVATQAGDARGAVRRGVERPEAIAMKDVESLTAGVGSKDRLKLVTTARGAWYLAWETTGWGWKVVWSVPKQTLERPVWQLARWSVGLGSLGLLVMVGVVATIAQRITGPIHRLQAAAAAVEAGDYGPDGLGSIGGRTDEFGQLARGFRRMVEEVAARERQLVEAHSSLEQSERHFRALIENASDIITVADRDGVIRYKSPSVRSILGHDPEDLVDRPATDFIHPDDRDTIRAALREFVDHPETPRRPIECRFRHRDGTWRILEGVGANLLDNPDVGGIVINSRDVTHRRKTEDEVRRLNAELDQRVQVKTAELHQRMEELAAAKDATDQAMKVQEIFVSNVAHDLRTPLAIVMGYSEDLLRRAKKKNLDAVIPDLKLIVNKGRDLLELINDLLNLSKLMSDKSIELDLKEFDVAAMVAGRMEGIGVLAKKYGNTIEFVPGPELGTMRADEVKVWRVLMNLVTNACKFTKDGRITVSAERVPGTAPAGDHVEFRVQDTGLGMSAEQRAQLFHRFAQVHSCSGKLQAGVGLGLSICQLYCDAMGGGIRVESEQGRGSTFVVTIPAVASDSTLRTRSSGVDESPPAPAPRQPSDAANMVLIIDDDQLICDLIARNLGDEGYHTRTVSSGEEGLRLAKQLLPSAIILDVVMPGIDGWAVLAALKTDSATAKIPIIMATMLDEKQRGLQLGAADYITKPFSRDALTEVVQRHLDPPAPAGILIVDDDPEVRGRLAAMVREQGWAVAEAGDGREALAQMERARPALVLLDLMLPTMDGYEVIAEMRGRPEWHSIPIIVVSGVEMNAEKRHQLRGEVEQVLQKGLYGRDELLNEIRARVGARHHTGSVIGATTDA